MYSLAELANRLGLAFTGDAQKPISGLSSLRMAGPEDLSFLSNEKYLSQLASTGAGAVMLPPALASNCPTACLLTDDPYLGLAHASRLFDDTPTCPAGIAAGAHVADGARVHPDSSVAPAAVIEASAVIERGASVGAGAYVGQGCHVGAHCTLHPGAVLLRDVLLGEGSIVHSHAVIGSDGFGFARSGQRWEKIHQLGGVRIGKRVEIGASTTIDRGTLDDTVIEDGVIIDNQVQIGHNCVIGKNTAIAGCVGLAGSTTVGANCTLAGGVGVVGHVEICDNVHITGMTMVTRSIDKPGSYSAGTRMSETSRWKRNAVRFSQLDAIARRLAVLETESDQGNEGQEL